MENGDERLIASASRTLSAAERNYAQIDREGAAIISGVAKFHRYIYGHKSKLVSDHKSLEGLLGRIEVFHSQHQHAFRDGLCNWQGTSIHSDTRRGIST